MPFGPKGLIVTWVGPVPEQAEVAYVDEKPFATASKAAGPEVPPDFPKKYLKDLQRVDLFNASMSWDAAQLTAWEKRHGIAMESGPLEIFDHYLKSNHVIFSTLVRHPPVPDPGAYRACSVVLQRGVIVMHPGERVDLYLRSYFHSAKDAEHFVNFVPKGGLRISFRSDSLWFPLELTREIVEPFSFVVLDVFTDKPLAADGVPKPFRVTSGKRVPAFDRNLYVSRLTAKLPGKEKAPDLMIRIGAVAK